MVGGVTTEFDRARAVLDVDDTDEAQDFARGGGFFLRVDIFFAAVAPAAAFDLAAAAAFEAASLAR